MKHPHGLPSDLNALVALDTMLDERSVTAAARRLGVTQSAMSHTLKRLRDVLGDPLFVSARSGLVPTARAVELAGPLRRALVDLGAAVSVGAPFDPGSSTKKFVLATADYGELVAVPRLLSAVRRKAPGVRVEVQRVGADVVARLEAGTIDLVAGLAIPPMANLRRTALANERFVVLARRGHPGARRPLTLKRYVALPHLLIAPAGAPGGIVDDWLAKRGLERQVVLRVPQFASAPFVVASSDLLLTAPEGLAIWARPFLDLEELAPPMDLPTSRAYATWHERNQDDPAQRWFRTNVVSAATTDGDVD
jgi:DNA-binding transcriptional LysR family regulator